MSDSDDKKKLKTEELRSMDEVFLNRLEEAIEANLENKDFSVDELGREIGMSRSQIHRKLHALTGKSASKFIRTFKLEKARELLQKNVGTVSEISFMMGFSSPAYFGQVFLEEFGYPPSEVRKKVMAEKKESEEISQLPFRVKILKNVDIFSGLESELLSEIAQTLSILNYGSGEIIIQKGEMGNAMYVIVDGKVKVHSGDIVFTYLTGGDGFGEYTLIDQELRSASVTTVVDTTLYKIDDAIFNDLIDNHPPFTKILLEVLVERLRKLDIVQEELTKLSRESLKKE